MGLPQRNFDARYNQYAVDTAARVLRISTSSDRANTRDSSGHLKATRRVLATKCEDHIYHWALGRERVRTSHSRLVFTPIHSLAPMVRATQPACSTTHGDVTTTRDGPETLRGALRVAVSAWAQNADFAQSRSQGSCAHSDPEGSPERLRTIPGGNYISVSLNARLSSRPDRRGRAVNRCEDEV